MSVAGPRAAETPRPASSAFVNRMVERDQRSRARRLLGGQGLVASPAAGGPAACGRYNPDDVPIAAFWLTAPYVA